MVFPTFCFLCFLSCCYQAFGRSQEIFFELENSNVNEIIFIGERDIVMRCGLTSLPYSDIKIEHAENIVAYNNRTGNCVNYTIMEVRSNDGGNYLCTANYTNSTVTLTFQKQLQIYIHDSTSPQCFRNGTMGTPYKEGDILLMTCYCPLGMKKCTWSKTELGSGLADVITPNETSTKDKTILRILEGPITAKDNITRFDCYFGNSPNERCSIGANSSKDVVFNLTTSSSFTNHCHSVNLSTELPFIMMTYMFSTTPLPLVDNPSYTLVLFSVIGMVIIIACSLAVCILFICFKRSRNEKSAGQESQSLEGDNPAMIYNTAYGISGTDTYAQEFQKATVTEYDVPNAKVNDQTLEKGVSQDAYKPRSGYGHSETGVNHVHTDTPKGNHTGRNVAVNDNSAPYAVVNADANILSNQYKSVMEPAPVSGRQPEAETNDFSELYAKVDKTRQSNPF